MRIAIDAGHGPNTAGKRSPDGSIREYQFNSVVAKYLVESLKQKYNVETLIVHEDGRDVPLQERTNKANAWKADVYISIHANASGNDWSTAHGIETYAYTSRPVQAVTLASAVQRHLIKATGLRDRGVKYANFHVLRETSMTAILAECGFMTHREEVEHLKSDTFRRMCADAIEAGIVEVYKLSAKAPDKPAEKFPDIKGHWAEKEIRAAASFGLLNGYTDGTFRPDQAVTRAELAVVLIRAKSKL